MSDASIWKRGIPYVQDGQPVKASVTNAPTYVLSDRTSALKAILDAIEAGEQLMFRDAPLAASISIGNVVYFKASDLVHDKAKAQWETVSGEIEATPADTAVYTGVVIDKAADRVGDILLCGLAVLTTVELGVLFGTTSPETGIYYLSSLTPGTVQKTSPAMSVRVLQYMGSGIIRVFAPDVEPVTHSHRRYYMGSAHWLLAASFDPDIVPVGAQYGFDLSCTEAIDQALSEALLPSVGAASFVYLYHDTDLGLGSSSSSSSVPCDLGGLHVDETLIVVDANGIWWMGSTPPYCGIEMEVVSADLSDIPVLRSILNRSPEALTVNVSNGRVTIAVKDMESDSDVAGHIVVKDIADWRMKKGPVVSSVAAGTGLVATSPQGNGQGDVTIQLVVFQDLRLSALIQNLNNAVTSVEDPYVLSLFPSNRDASISCKVAIPNLGTAVYVARIYAQFLSPGASQTPPGISLVRIPTPYASGVTPASVVVPVFPNFPSSVVAGNVYLVESGTIGLVGFSGGLFEFTLRAVNPSPELKMLDVGVRLSLV